MTWSRGKDAVGGLLDQGELERVEPSARLADRLIDEAGRHIQSALHIAETDPTGSYQLAYDGARKSASALLAAQGLRATTAGGHVAVQDTVRAQFGGSFGAYPRLRRKRAASEYPNTTSPNVTVEEAYEAIERASEMLKAARDLLGSGELTLFER